MITHGRNSALPANGQVSHISVSGEPTAAAAPSRSSQPCDGRYLHVGGLTRRHYATGVDQQTGDAYG